MLIPVLAFVGNMTDYKQNAGKESFLSIISVVLSGLVPIVGRLILPTETLSVIWKVLLGFVVFVNFFACIRYTAKKKAFLISFLIVTILSVLPFVYYGKLISDADLNFTAYLSGNYPQSIFTVCIPLFLIGFIIGYVVKPARQNRDFAYRSTLYSEPLDEVRNEMDRLTIRFDRIYTSFNSQLKTLSSIVDKMGVNILLSKYPAKDGSKVYDQKIASLLSKLKDDVAVIKAHMGHVTTKEINDDQVVLVRELSHFMATPLATIDASIKNLNATVKTKNEDKLNENAQRIISAVAICNGILSTYKEIFVSGSPVDSDNLQSLINSSFELYKDSLKKNLKLNLKINNQYEGISNYYILSTILPVLSNAVTAARENSTIEIQEIGGIVKISNTYEGDVDVRLFDQDGYSSKENHRGMGLFTVRHFLARRKLGNLSYYKKDNRIYFEIPIIPQDHEST